MTVSAARRPRRRAAPSPEPLPAPVESLAIGEINQTVFDCPKCARPLAIGATRCPGCGTRLVLGVPMSKVSLFVAAGLAMGLAFGGAAGFAVGLTRVATPAGPVVAAPGTSVAPIVAGGGSPTTTATPDPSTAPSGTPSNSDMPSLTASALVQAVTVNGHLAAAADALRAASTASPFDASEVAQILRTISADAVYGEGLATRLSGWPGSASVGSDLAAAYGAIHDVAAEGLTASVQNTAAYRESAKAMLRLLAGLGSVDQAAQALATGHGVPLPEASPAP
jgi:hypothetical protein